MYLQELIKKASEEQQIKVESNDKDYMFITFILNNLPRGLIGLLLAVILSAAMSSTSSEKPPDTMRSPAPGRRPKRDRIMPARVLKSSSSSEQPAMLKRVMLAVASSSLATVVPTH